MIYVNLAIGCFHGWGIIGKYVTRELSKLEPVCLIAESTELEKILCPLEYFELRHLWLEPEQRVRMINEDGIVKVDGPLLQGIGGERLLPRQLHIRGRWNIGYAVFENNLMQSAWVENGRKYFDRIVTGSTWSANILKEAGLETIENSPHGIDTSIFSPRPDYESIRDFFEGKFVVFSGGKFEFRKGQDIVIRAYKVLQNRHPDVLLVNAWFNPWPVTMETMKQSSLINFAIRPEPYLRKISQILADNGIDLNRVITVSSQPNTLMARIYQNTDVGIFPNRCEGGTNMVLMEYMACGCPVIAVNTTGHADIITANNAMILNTRGETTVYDHRHIPVACWPEPDLDDAIDKLEWAYQHRDKLREYGRKAGQDLSRFTWHNTAEILHKAIKNISK